MIIVYKSSHVLALPDCCFPTRLSCSSSSSSPMEIPQPDSPGVTVQVARPLSWNLALSGVVIRSGRVTEFLPPVPTISLSLFIREETNVQLTITNRRGNHQFEKLSPPFMSLIGEPRRSWPKAWINGEEMDACRPCFFT